MTDRDIICHIRCNRPKTECLLCKYNHDRRARKTREIKKLQSDKVYVSVKPWHTSRQGS